jgi:type II secretory pathway component PulJ
MNARRAFTLMEVLLALALMMMLLGAFYLFLRGAGTSQQVARAAANRQLNARMLCDLVERDLMCCLVGDASSGAGVKGSATELHVLTRAVTTSLATNGYEDRTALADLEAADFTFHESAKEVSIRRSIQQSFQLPARDGERERSEPPASSETVDLIERMRFRYFDGSTWQETFDSLAQNRLPVAVEVALWLHPLAGDEWAEETRLSEDAARADIPDEIGADEAMFSRDDERDPGPDDEMPAESEDEEPPPDVVRIVIIPDAQPGGADEGVANP